MSELGSRLASALDELRSELLVRHRWTHLEVTARIDADARRLVLRGEVAVDRLVARVVEAARKVAPGWTIEHDAIRVVAGGSWYVLPSAVSPRPVLLWADCPACTKRYGMVTELRPEAGPVQRLGAREDYTLVRGQDGTVGWFGALGDEVQAPRLAAPRGDDPKALVDAARAWLGTPYRLGGVTMQGVDCSALVQRLLVEQLGVLVPRHSSDQLKVAPREGAGTGLGNLVFVWSARESLRGMCHVGIDTGGRVLHASLSRRGVVEDSMEEFLADTRRAMHVPFGELLAFGRRVAGHPSLVAAGVRLGGQP